MRLHCSLFELASVQGQYPPALEKCGAQFTHPPNFGDSGIPQVLTQASVVSCCADVTDVLLNSSHAMPYTFFGPLSH